METQLPDGWPAREPCQVLLDGLRLRDLSRAHPKLRLYFGSPEQIAVEVGDGAANAVGLWCADGQFGGGVLDWSMPSVHATSIQSAGSQREGWNIVTNKGEARAVRVSRDHHVQNEGAAVTITRRCRRAFLHQSLVARRQVPIQRAG
jgi:hypothetical protein